MDIKFGGRKKLVVLTGGLFLVSFLLLPPNVLAYNSQTTHPDLVREIIVFYELSTGKKLTDEQKQWIIQGSIDEDKAPRWLNHFYDPAFETGLSTTAAGFGYAGYSAKNWAQFSSYQTLNPANLANLWLGNGPVISGSWWGDFSYEAAIKNYSHNKEKEAYIALGSVLHLIKDMTVPEHTRNDAHPGEPLPSYYENWTMNNSAGLTQDLGKRVFNQGWKPVIYGGLETYFNELANYTNTHFFSPRTINSELYQKPKIIFNDGTFAYGYDENYQLFDLAVVTVDKSLKKSYSLKDDNYQILQEYWIRLSRQAIVNGAGVISLFVNQAEAAKKIELAKQKVDSNSINSPQNSFMGFISGLFSSSPGKKNPEPVMTIVAGEPKTAAPKVNPASPATPKAPQGVQTPAASPPVLAVPKTMSKTIPAPSTAPADSANKKAISSQNNTGAETPARPQNSAPTYTYSGGGGSGGGGGTSADSTSNSASGTTATTTASTEENTGAGTTFSAGDLVINEIMYNPEGADTNHEWIEIYNNSGREITLTGGSNGWKFYDENESLHRFNEPPLDGSQGTLAIAAGGYFILTGNADTFVNTDYIGYNATVIDTAMTLKNSSSTIKILAPDGTTIDEMAYSNSWGGNGDGKTMERKSASGSSSDSANWGASAAVGGTPGAANSLAAEGEGGPITDAGTNISATTTISQNTTWILANSPYRLFFDAQNRPTVAVGVTLTIEPGVKIIPQSGGTMAMEIKGTLQAIATSGAPIIFTSKNDADGDAATVPQKGDWLNIVFSGASGAAQSNLDYVEFRYGGGQNITAPFYEMVDVVGATININHSKFENSKYTALHLKDSSGAVQNSVFSDNNCGISVDSSNGVANVSYGNCYGTHTTGQVLSSAGLQIKNNQFIRNKLVGIEVRSGTAPTIDGNIFTDNGYPVKIESSYPAITNSQLANTSTSTSVISGIAISGYTHFSQNFTLKKDLPYVLETNGPALAPYVDAGATLTIEPGTILKTGNANSVLFVNGGLIASTTADSPIVFTSLKDDARGGDTNGDGSITSPQDSDWGNISFASGSIGDFVNTIFNYAGYGYVPPAPVPPILLADFSAVALSWDNSEKTSGNWTADKNGSFEKIVLHSFTASNPKGYPYLIGIKKGSDNSFIASTTVDNLRNITSVQESSILLSGNFTSGETYYATLKVVPPEGIAVDPFDLFGIGKDINQKAAIAFYETAEQPYSNPALSIDAGATVVVE